jgi:Protein of unknown function (DUF3667).
LVETAECPGCGRRFVGDYCPDCGREATPSDSTGGVVEDFAREFLDIERGFLETVWALTVVPGQSLRAYLNGDRTQLMSPGRYLLGTFVIQFVVIQGLIWTGALVSIRRSSVAAPDGLLSTGAPPVLTETIVTLLQFARSQEGQIATYLVVVGLFAVALRRLFQSHIDRSRGALALSSFLVGHAVLLETVAHLAWVAPARLLIGGPINPTSQAAISMFSGIAVAVFLGYVGWASHRCFGPGVSPVAKCIFGAIWVLLEAEALFGVTAIGYVSWVAWGEPSGVSIGYSGLAVLAGLCAVPFLLHAGAEGYLRLRTP